MALFLGNSNVVELSGVKNSVSGEMDTSATVIANVYNMAGTKVTGPVTLQHNNDEPGTYQGTLAPDVGLEENREYEVHYDVVGSGGEVGHWEKTEVAQVRTT